MADYERRRIRAGEDGAPAVGKGTAEDKSGCVFHFFFRKNAHHSFYFFVRTQDGGRVGGMTANAGVDGRRRTGTQRKTRTRWKTIRGNFFILILFFRKKVLTFHFTSSFKRRSGGGMTTYDDGHKRRQVVWDGTMAEGDDETEDESG